MVASSYKISYNFITKNKQITSTSTALYFAQTISLVHYPTMKKSCDEEGKDRTVRLLPACAGGKNATPKIHEIILRAKIMKKSLSSNFTFLNNTFLCRLRKFNMGDSDGGCIYKVVHRVGVVLMEYVGHSQTHVEDHTQFEFR